jgi:hypothetical protein
MVRQLAALQTAAATVAEQAARTEQMTKGTVQLKGQAKEAAGVLAEHGRAAAAATTQVGSVSAKTASVRDNAERQAAAFDEFMQEVLSLAGPVAGEERPESA